MSSEHASGQAPISAPISEQAPRDQPELEQAPVEPPLPPSKEGDPFASGQASPRRQATSTPPNPIQVPPALSTNPHASRYFEEKQDGESFSSLQQPNQGLGRGVSLPPPNRPPDLIPGVRRARTVDTNRGSPNQRRSAIDWIVPAVEAKPNSLALRLQPTIDVAVAERDKYALKAKWTGWTLNIAIGLPSLTRFAYNGSVGRCYLWKIGRGADDYSCRHELISIDLPSGGLATIVASYLARSRGSNEPELSITRVKDLEQFIRECESFKMDHGTLTSNQFDQELESKRRRFEELLGNANGERKLSPPV